MPSQYWEIISNTYWCLSKNLNSLWLSNVPWRHRSRFDIDSGVACCLTAPSHHLNQSLLDLSDILHYLPEGITTENTEESHLCNALKIAHLKAKPHTTEMPDGTKPSPEPLLRNYQRCSVTFTSEQFHEKVFGDYTVKIVTRGQWLNSLWPGNAIWCHKLVSTLAQVIWLVAWPHNAITWTNVDLS